MAIVGNDIDHAVSLLCANKLVGIPTETVYGLAGNAYSQDAVLDIFKVKRRPSFDPLIVHAASLERVADFVLEIPPEAENLANQLWPGPLTILLKKKDIISDLVTSGLDTVAVRVPRHPLTLSLLKVLDFPLAAPSANPFGYISPTTPAHVNEQLGNEINYILDGGPCSVGVESTIVSFEKKIPTILRLGGQPIERIMDILGEVEVNEHSSSQPDAPGMLKSHYAPSKPLILGGLQEVPNDIDKTEIGALVFGEMYTDLPEENQISLSDSDNIEQAAKNLFGAMRELDQKTDIRVIIAQLVPDHGLGRAINDRLKRAATR